MAEEKQVQFGGSFAPPLTPELLDKYETMLPGLEPRIADIFSELLTCARKFQETGESKLPGTPHRSGIGVIVPLEEKEKKRIWDFVPWMDECDLYGQVLDRLPAGDVRNAAYHLLWYARELTLDREPITTDKL